MSRSKDTNDVCKPARITLTYIIAGVNTSVYTSQLALWLKYVYLGTILLLLKGMWTSSLYKQKEMRHVIINAWYADDR